MRSGETRKALPGKAGVAYCRFCANPQAKTRWEDGVEVYDESHPINGGTVTCYTSKNQPVVPPVRGRR